MHETGDWKEEIEWEHFTHSWPFKIQCPVGGLIVAYFNISEKGCGLAVSVRDAVEQQLSCIRASEKWFQTADAYRQQAPGWVER